ncbi:MAG: efflux RND transporter periplasmic adaptor subunit [Pseudomonadota bacterium]
MDDRPSPSPSKWLRTLARLGSLTLTLATLALAGALVIGGRGVLGEWAEAVELPEPAPRLAVQTAPFVMEEGYEVERRFAGQIQPAQRTTMAFEQGGTLAALMVDEGDRVAAGDTVATLDKRLLEAERARLVASRSALEAQAELSRRTTERQSVLRDRGHATPQALDDLTLGLAEIEGRIAEVDAGIAAVDVQLDKTVLTAPFTGVVAARYVDDGAAVGSGQRILSLVQTDRPQFRVGLSPSLVGALRTHSTRHVTFGAARHRVRLAAVLPELDPATRTRTVLLDFVDGEIPAFRETGELVLRQFVEERGAWLPVAALQDGPRGLWQVMTALETPDGWTVGTEAVEVLFAEADRVFVRGTFTDGARYLTDGPHRIVHGQEVAVLTDGVR